MDFLNTPFLPAKQIKTALVDYRIEAEAVESLQKMGIELIKTVKCKELYNAIDGHPDIIAHPTGDNKVVVAPNVFNQLEPMLTKKGFALTKGNTWLNRNYPDNIAYNVLRIGNLAFHNTKYTDKVLKIEFEKMNVKLIHVNQGYTKCSACIIDKNTIITSDYKLSNIAEKYGIESLLIKPDGITLFDLDYGFIGGSSGLLSSKTLALTGILDKIEDNYKILDFLKRKGIVVKILTTKQIFDIGSIIPLTY